MADSAAPDATPAGAAAPLPIVDTFARAEPLIDTGVGALARAATDALRLQVECSVEAVAAADRVNAVAAAGYAELRDNVSDVRAFYADAKEKRASDSED
jgi:hypothetical protein